MNNLYQYIVPVMWRKKGNSNFKSCTDKRINFRYDIHHVLMFNFSDGFSNNREGTSFTVIPVKIIKL